MIFYVTTAANHPCGAGYWEVQAPDEMEARIRANTALEGVWAFIYTSLDHVHELDRKRCHGRLG